jgi:hypothetical protein
MARACASVAPGGPCISNFLPPKSKLKIPINSETWKMFEEQVT